MTASEPLSEDRDSTPERADLAAWLAVVAGSIGSFMALLDISIVNSALPTIQGEIGASGTEGTWIGTSYLVAEIVVIAIAGWLVRILGLRLLLVLAASLFMAFSVLCGLAQDLGTMIVGRIGQGLTGGAMIPTAMLIIAFRLPRSQQALGTAGLAIAAVLGPLLGPIVGGWLTEALSWRYAFFINLPVGVGLLVLLMMGLPPSPRDWSELRYADWSGALGLTCGLGSLTVLLEEGQREQWFDSIFIRQLAGVAVVGAILVAVGQFRARRPVINLRLFRRPAVGPIMAMMAVLGAIFYGFNYAIPQFLGIIASYNALQAGKIAFIAGLPMLILMPVTPLLMSKLDIRPVVGVTVLMVAWACWQDAQLTADAAGESFVITQIVRGGAMAIAMIFLNQAAVESVPMEDAGDVSGLFNVARNLGGSFGLAGIATIQDHQSNVHLWEINQTLSANDPDIQSGFSSLVAAFGAGDEAATGAYLALQKQLGVDALVMSFNDVFFVLALACLVVAPLAMLLRPLPKSVAMVVH